MSAIWFGRGISEAISNARERKSLLLVFVADTSKFSTEAAAALEVCSYSLYWSTKRHLSTDRQIILIHTF